MIIYKTKDVTVFQSAMFQLNTTVVTTKDLVLVVDPGYLPLEVDEIRLFVDKIRGDRPIYLYFTHSDYDHIAGYGAFPDAKTIASKEFVESPLMETQIKDLIKYDDEFYLNRSYAIKYPEINHVITRDGQQIVIGETVITFYHAFGHNNDGLLAVIESMNLLIAGDYLSDIEFPFIYYSLSEYEKTLNTLQKLANVNKNLILVTSHGSVTDEATDIQKRIDDSIDYLHLLKNEPSDLRFNEFLSEKNYQFITVFKRRHQDNLNLWRNLLS